MKRSLAMYIRLSDADDEVDSGAKSESGSITSQRKMLYSYINEHSEFSDYNVLEYFDDGFTGTEFDKRIEFKRMISDAQAGRFDTLIVKDLSRFGRDYLEVGNYMEFIFPSMGIRFIAVNDYYDSDRNFGMTGGMDVAFKNLIYQMYSRDLSKKVKTARRNRNLNGEYTGSFALYGYKKDPSDRHKLLIDEETAGIVREIFALADSGKNCNEIARILNERKVPTRIQNQWKHGARYSHVLSKGDYIWEESSVYDLLENEMYTGVLIQNRYEVSGYGKYKKINKCERSKWSIIPGAVPAIISREIYHRVSSRIHNKSFTKIYKGLFNPFICPYCGRKLQVSNATERYAKYKCKKRNYLYESDCQQISMSVESAKRMVVSAVNEEAALRIDVAEVERFGRQSQNSVQKQIKALNAEYESIESSNITYYTKYRDGQYTKEEYIKIRNDNKELLENIKSQIESLNDILNKADTEEQAGITDTLRACSVLKEYDADLISRLVEKVYIYNDKDIEVVFK